jgi:hypothetical protein
MHLARPQLWTPDLARVFADSEDFEDWLTDCESVLTNAPERWQTFERLVQYVGVSEDAGPNADSSGHIATWLSEADAGPGGAYCAAFASQALPRGERKSAGAQALGRRYPAISAGELSFLDLFWYPTGEWQGHIGLVIGGDILLSRDHVTGRPAYRGQVLTLEGNAQNKVRVQRRRSEQLWFARMPRPFGGKLPGVVLTGTQLVETHSETR